MNFFANVPQEWALLFMLNGNGGGNPPPVQETRIIEQDSQEPRIVREDTQEYRVT